MNDEISLDREVEERRILELLPLSLQFLSVGDFGKSMLSIRKLIAVAATSLLAACCLTSEGVALGVRGSPAWNKTAPKADVVSKYDSKRDFELCSAGRSVTAKLSQRTSLTLWSDAVNPPQPGT
jgi:hypothetical protein